MFQPMTIDGLAVIQLVWRFSCPMEELASTFLHLLHVVGPDARKSPGKPERGGLLVDLLNLWALISNSTMF